MTFPFESGTASHVGNLAYILLTGSSFNSTNAGYVCGGYTGSVATNAISKFTFPFDSGTASNIGNLVSSNDGPTGVDNTDFVFQFA